jgi:23S rRNA (uracil1939-C5)-methyltransferase
LSIPPSLSVGAELELQVKKVTIGGHGVAEVGGLDILVPGAVPGEKVRARISSKHGDCFEARLEEVLKTSPGSRPRGEHVRECGGCIWQHLPYEKQLALKEGIIRDALDSLVPLDAEARRHLPGRVLNIIPSPTITHYKNKLELTFGMLSGDGALQKNRGGRLTHLPAVGFHQPGTWNTVIAEDPCGLYDERLSSLLIEMQAFIADAGLSIYNPRTRRGVLRSLILRRGVRTEEEMLCFLVQARRRELEKHFQKFLRFGERPQVRSLLIVEHFSQGSAPRQPARSHVLKGAATVRENMFDLTFDLSPFSFFHCNTLGAEKLYASIAAALELSGKETLLDCYCGIGAIGQYLSRFCRHVVGVESHPRAIEDALSSSSRNRISNISFYHGRAEEVLMGKLRRGKKYTFDSVVLDPPRGGVSEITGKAVMEHTPQKIVYVSSNPATLARDLGTFLTGGYDLRLVQPVDLFPHTAHVETVSLLQRR